MQIERVEAHLSRRHQPRLTKLVLNEAFLVFDCEKITLLGPFFIVLIIGTHNIFCSFAELVLLRIATLPDNQESGGLAGVIVTIDIDLFRFFNADHSLIEVLQIFERVYGGIEEAILVWIALAKIEVFPLARP